ncbi:hypothetical protein RRG08_028962 [Elysia crispata]|uniref:Uncharacterized protein n=1 Tax=Elysia crispata TaxID=231223 RepID=A0AAE1AQ07_9GAST|nr:hypothetical protein RRG08_028962 [Elysia crispata]
MLGFSRVPYPTARQHSLSRGSLVVSLSGDEFLMRRRAIRSLPGRYSPGMTELETEAEFVFGSKVSGVASAAIVLGSGFLAIRTAQREAIN